MEKKTSRLYPSAPLEIIYIEQRLKKTINDLTSFKDSNSNTTELITYFSEKNRQAKRHIETI